MAQGILPFFFRDLTRSRQFSGMRYDWTCEGLQRISANVGIALAAIDLYRAVQWRDTLAVALFTTGTPLILHDRRTWRLESDSIR